MVERCALSGSDLKIKFRTILLTSIMEAWSQAISSQVKSCTQELGLCKIYFMYFGITT